MKIEMLRAHMPKLFKAHGSEVAIRTSPVTNKTLAMTQEEHQELIEMRQRSLRRIAESKRLPVPEGIMR